MFTHLFKIGSPQNLIAFANRLYPSFVYSMRTHSSQYFRCHFSMILFGRIRRENSFVKQLLARIYSIKSAQSIWKNIRTYPTIKLIIHTLPCMFGETSTGMKENQICSNLSDTEKGERLIICIGVYIVIVQKMFSWALDSGHTSSFNDKLAFDSVRKFVFLSFMWNIVNKAGKWLLLNWVFFWFFFLSLVYAVKAVI